ncbi:MAG: hypothetical protein EA352_00450 [Gemmatimonadales bacterium]|nr:MAG: hypothetical protein EA352_00450 [Gemmatimonadales bacterium]
MHLHIVHEAGFTLPGKSWAISENYCADWALGDGVCRRYFPDTYSVYVDDWREIEGAVRHIQVTVEAVTFHAHGNSGYLMGISRSNLIVVGRWIRPLFRDRGIVNFSACNVAQGEAGEAFMEEAARQLLPSGGGSVVAMDSRVFTYPLLGTREPFWGREVAAVKSPDGTVTLERSRR